MDGVVPASAAQACRMARERGHVLYLCSGRNAEEIEIIPELASESFDGIISSGGARVEVGGTVVFDALIPAETARKIYQYLNGLECGVALERTNEILSNKRNIALWTELMKTFPEGSGKRGALSDLLDIQMRNVLSDDPERACYESVNKIVFRGDAPGLLAALRRDLGDECEIFDSSIPFFDGEGGEIGPKGVHKGSALRLVAERHGIALADTIAFGDSDNDRPMIEAAGVGVVMGNADDSLKAIAGMVTTSLDDDGIFNGFKKLKLI